MVLLFYTAYISVDLAQHEIFRAKVGKGGIKQFVSHVITQMIHRNVPHCMRAHHEC